MMRRITAEQSWQEQNMAADNILGQKEVVMLKTIDVKGIKKQFYYIVPKYSVSVLRLKTQ